MIKSFLKIKKLLKFLEISRNFWKFLEVHRKVEWSGTFERHERGFLTEGILFHILHLAFLKDTALHVHLGAQPR